VPRRTPWPPPAPRYARRSRAPSVAAQRVRRRANRIAPGARAGNFRAEHDSDLQDPDPSLRLPPCPNSARLPREEHLPSCALIGALSPLVRPVNSLHRAAPYLVPRHNLAAQALLGQVHRLTGLDPLAGAPGLPEALDCLTRDLRTRCRLTLLGRWVAHTDLRSLLVHRARIRAALDADPAIGAQSVPRPIVVTGLPRSGTTLLHRLLALDPAHRAARTWEIMLPLPAGGSSHPADVRSRIRRAERQLCWFRSLARGVDTAHALGAMQPEECIAFMAQSMVSPRFHATYWVPEYERWLQQADWLPAYSTHRAMLLYLQRGAPQRRWVLKAPAHLEALRSLLRVYPDALVVQLHREPHQALGSVASLTRMLQSAFQVPPDDRSIGDQVITRWSRVAREALAARSTFERRGLRILDLDYHELTRDPIEAVRAVYAARRETLAARAEQRMRAYLADHRAGAPAPHEYDGEAFGITRARVRHAFAEYYDALESLRARGRID